jgi:hypothetical protein
MSRPEIYTDRLQVRTATETILNYLRPGDVVTQIGRHLWWQLPTVISHWGIHWYQKRLFGKQSRWKFTHAMLFFDEDNTFSVELPRATLKPLQEYCLSRFSIFRIQTPDLTPEMIGTLREGIREILGSYFDIGQLFDIALTGLLGYENIRRVQLFDFGQKQKICSVGVRVAFEYLFQQHIRSASHTGKWLFDSLDPVHWPLQKIAKFKGTDVEATTPAHFANSERFSNEFRLVASFENGKKIE